MHHYYKSEAPDVVAIVQEYFQARDQLQQRIRLLGEAFGGEKAAVMRDITSHFAGGIKFSAARDLDVHWKRPDQFGFRSLRAKPLSAKGLTKELRAQHQAEHDRLLDLWKQHCPPELDIHSYWDRLSINTGNLMLGGGIKFEHQGIAYFALGFDINKADHEAKVAAGKPTSGWINGAVEILPSEYEAARLAKVGGAA